MYKKTVIAIFAFGLLAACGGGGGGGGGGAPGPGVIVPFEPDILQNFNNAGEAGAEGIVRSEQEISGDGGTVKYLLVRSSPADFMPEEPLANLSGLRVVAPAVHGFQYGSVEMGTVDVGERTVNAFVFTDTRSGGAVVIDDTGMAAGGPAHSPPPVDSIFSYRGTTFIRQRAEENLYAGTFYMEIDFRGGAEIGRGTLRAETIDNEGFTTFRVTTAPDETFRVGRLTGTISADGAPLRITRVVEGRDQSELPASLNGTLHGETGFGVTGIFSDNVANGIPLYRGALVGDRRNTE